MRAREKGGYPKFLGVYLFGVFPWGLLVGSLRGVWKMRKILKGRACYCPSLPLSVRYVCRLFYVKEVVCIISQIY